ncbi:MAG: cyclic nucleotide-binding domain-containing protein, partial [Acidimicrobiales bacterium]
YGPDQALTQLRRQLDSPGEDFPKRVLRRRERVSKAARVEMLGSVGLFQGLSKRHTEAIAKVADDVVIEPGSVLIEEGSEGDQFFIVVTGELSVQRRGATLARCCPGECFGEMSLLDGGPRSATVTAETVSVLLSLDRSAFTAVLLDNPSVSVALLELLSSRIRSLSP